MNNIVLFGVTGDLARQKLIPTLFTLYSNHELKQDVQFFGFGRKPFIKNEFSNFLRLICGSNTKEVNSFIKRWTYIQSELEDSKGFSDLSNHLSGSALIYISLPPQFHMPVMRQLLKAKVIGKKMERRVAFEKPYGFDLNSSRILDAYVSKHLNQNQILRIDHYTGKEALLDLEKVARFGIFKDMLSSKTISKIEIRFHEKKTIENRGMFYEETGALRDVGQNHVLYMLSHVLTLPFLHESIESASAIRAKQLDSIVFNPKASLYQYDTYTNESHVKKNSNTETFFVFEGIVKNTVWNNTKVVLSGGKGLKEDDVAIYIYFRKNKEPLRIPVGTYGERGAYIHVLLAALSWNVDMFPDFKQIETSWNIIEKIKKNSKLKGTYKKGTTPLV